MIKKNILLSALLTLAIVSCSKSATKSMTPGPAPVDSTQHAKGAPGQKIDLSSFTLQLPIADGNSIRQVSNDELKNYSSSYFYWDDGSQSIHFFCSSDGITTANSHYPRTELRAKNDWHFKGRHTLAVRVAVLQQPSTGKIIIGQIHGDSKGTEALKIWWNNGDIQAGYKNEVNGNEERVTLLKNVPLGTVFTYKIEQSDHDVTVYVNDQQTKKTLGKSWDSESVYFKAGNYLQDNQQPVSSGLVAIYSIDMQL